MNDDPYSTCLILHDDNFETSTLIPLNPNESVSQTFRGIHLELASYENSTAIELRLIPDCNSLLLIIQMVVADKERKRIKNFLSRLDEDASTLLGKCHWHSKCVGQDFECLLLSIHEISSPVPTERHQQQDLWHSLLQIKSLLLVTSNPAPTKQGHHYTFDLSQALTSVLNKETCT